MIIKLIFSLLAILVPLAAINGNQLTYFLPRLGLMSALLAFCAASLGWVAFRHGKIVWSWVSLAFVGLLLIRGILIFPVTNFGLQVQPLLMLIALFIIPLWMINFSLTLRLQLFLFLTVILACAISGVEWAYYKESFFSPVNPSGGPIGSRNSLAIFLAQLLPLLMMLFAKPMFKSKWSNHAVSSLILVALFTSIITIVTYRTRCAWLMVIIECGLLLFLYRRRLRILDFRTLIASIIFVLSITFAVAVPNKFKWQSVAPYSESLSSLVNPMKSNGRIELWRVGLEIVRAHPLLGVGTGRYPVVWTEYIERSLIDPSIFKLGRMDLPIFNDYLQVAVENGLFVAGLYMATFFLPLIFYLRQPERSIYGNFALASCVASCVAAFVDYPFWRAENVVFYAIALGILQRESQRLPQTSKVNPIIVVLLPTALFCAVLSWNILQSTFYRWAFLVEPSVEHLENGWRAWPYDIAWGFGSIDFLLHRQQIELAEQFSEARLRYWPLDSFSTFFLAQVRNRQGRVKDVKSLLEQSLRRAPGGRCNETAAQYYKYFMRENKKVFPENSFTDEKCL